MKRDIHGGTGAPKTGAARTAGMIAVLSGILMAAAQAQTVPMTFGTPTVTGAGVGQTALYSNVATQDGVDIDMLATITAQDTGDVHDIRAAGDDHMLDMQGAGNRTVTIRYEFFESGTSNPLAIQEMVWAIDDLDGYSSRTEKLEVTGASAYTLNDPTNLSVEEAGSLLRFTGTQNQSAGDPESAVALLFADKQELTMTYIVLASIATEAGYNHDGDGDFAFAAPVQSVVEPNLFYTFTLTNDEAQPVQMDFTDVLPGSLIWDDTYEPVTSGALSITPEMLSFTESDKRVTISDFELPVGTSTFTLRTRPASEPGTVENEARTTPSPTSGFPQVDIVAYSSIDLPGGPNSRPLPEAGPSPLGPPMIMLAGGPTETTITLADPNLPGVSTLYFVLVPVPSSLGCDIISGVAPPPGSFTPYGGPIAVPAGTYPGGFAVIAYSASLDPDYADSGHAIDYDEADIVGLAGGHFDVDTTNGGAAGDTYDDDVWPSWPGGGSVDQHTHEYDDSIDSAIIDLMNPGQGHAGLADNVAPGTPFKILVINANLSPKAHIAVNSDVDEGSPYVMAYDNTAFEGLPVFSVDGAPGTTQLTKLQIGFDDDAIMGAGLLPTSSGAARGNTPGKDGEWRNGALAIQIVRVNPDGTPIAPLDYAKSSGGHGVAPAGTMEHELSVYWHWSGSDYDNPSNPYTPVVPPTVTGEVESNSVPVCDGL